MTKVRRVHAHRASPAGAGLGSKGAAAVEFGLIAPLLLLLVAGLVDFASYISSRIELEQALRAGGQYALMDFTNYTAITSAVMDATDLRPLTVEYDPVADTYCECPDGTANVCPGDSDYASCAGGERPGLFITITSSTNFDPPFAGLAGLTDGMTISQNLTLRVR